MRGCGKRTLVWLALAALSTPVATQTVHTVGPSGFAQIGGAIAVASPGDIIKVDSGFYHEFSCDKAVTIAAMPGANVVVYSALSWPSMPCTFALPAGGCARVRGIRFHSFNFIQLAWVEVTSGTVAFEECHWLGDLAIEQCVLVEGASVSMRDCSMLVGNTAFSNPAVRLIDARFAAVDCDIEGSTLVPDGGGSAGHGIWATNSSVHLTRCDVRGGDTFIFSCFYPSGDAVLTDRGDLTWIVDSHLTGGSAPPCGVYGIAGAGLRNTSMSPALLTRTTLTAGTATTASQPSVGPTADGHLIGLAAATPEIQLGAPYQVSFQAEPNEALFVLASLDLRSQLPVFSQEATWLPANDVFFMGLAAADSAGLATFAIGVPGHASLDHKSIWLHAAALSTSPWRIGAPVGGVIR